MKAAPRGGLLLRIDYVSNYRKVYGDDYPDFHDPNINIDRERDFPVLAKDDALIKCAYY